MNFRFSYAVTRDITLPWFHRIFFVAGVIWILVITLVNFATVGYERVSFFGNQKDFNDSNLLWYSNFLLPSLRGNRNCTGATLKFSDGTILLE